MSFSLICLYQCRQSENISLFSESQIAGGVIDSVLVAAVCIIASLCLAHFSGSVLLPNYASYILLGSAALIVVADAITLIIHSYKKFTALTEKLNEQILQAGSSPNGDKDRQIQVLAEQMKELETKNQRFLKTITGKDTHIQDLQKQLKELETKIQKSATTQSQKDIQIEALNQKVENLEKALQDETSIKGKKESRINALIQQLTALRAKIQEYRMIIQSQEAVKSEGHADPLPKKVYLEVKADCDEQNFPCLEKDRLFVSKAQAALMEKDPYFSTFLKNDWDMAIPGEYANAFLANLMVFLHPKIHLLCEQRDTLGFLNLKREIDSSLKDFRALFHKLGLSKDAAFVCHGAHLISKALETVLENLNYAEFMSNRVLALFWCQALQKHMPFDQCIDQFGTILDNTQLPQHPEYLHEILFEILISNFQCQDAQDFFNTYPGKLKIKTLQLSSFLDILKDCSTLKNDPNPANIEILDRILNKIECEYVNVLYNDGGCVCHEVKYLLSQCTQIVCIQAGSNKTGRGKDIGALARLEKDIPVVDLTNYEWRTDLKYFISTPERVHAFRKSNETSSAARIIYLPKYSDKVDAYLKTYRGLKLEDFETVEAKKFYIVSMEMKA